MADMLQSLRRKYLGGIEVMRISRNAARAGRKMASTFVAISASTFTALNDFAAISFGFQKIHPPEASELRPVRIDRD